MNRGRNHLIERKNLTRMEFAYLALEQGGKCGNCGVKLTFLEPRSVRDEHLQALSMGGTNDLSNRELWCVSCAKAKNKKEAPILAKCKRLNQETGVNRKKKKIQSRGFQDRNMPEDYSAWKWKRPNVKQLDESYE